MEIGARVPWRVGVALAIGTGVVLHLFAINPAADPPRVTTVAELGNFANARLIGVIAWFMQFIIPACLLIGAAGSYLRRSKPKSTRKGVVETARGGSRKNPWRHG
jgi:hypothetical protein